MAAKTKTRRREIQNSFSSGTIALFVSGLLVKCLGMVYKIPLTNLLGDEGMGYFNAAYTVYSLFFVIATAGLPVALSLLVCEAAAKGEERRVGKLYAVASRLFLAIGLVMCLLMALPAKGFARLLGSENAAAGILAVSPALLFMSCASALRGYFQGRRQMTPIALSQVMEAGGKMLFGLAFAYLAIGYYEKSTVAAYAIFGLTLATFLATLSLVLAKKRFDSHVGLPTPSVGRLSRAEKSGIAKQLVKIAFPITLATSAMTLASSVDLFLVMRLLQKVGYSAAQANAAWGNYSALAVPLFNMPTVLILPIAYSVAPFVRGAIAKGSKEIAKSALVRALSIASLIGMTAALGLSLLSEPILSLLYTDAASVAKAAPLLAVLALSVFPLSLLTVTSALLQAYGKLWFPIATVGIGILLKVFISVFWMPRIGMTATPIGTLVCYTVVAALQLGALVWYSGSLSLARLLLKPFLVAFPTALSALFSHRVFKQMAFHGNLVTLLALFAAVIVFLVFARLVRALTREDAVALGFSERMAERLCRWHILSQS